MLEENNNLKSHLKDSSNLLVSGSNFFKDNLLKKVSYTKTNKLISALYMVTDIMDTEEPLRNKLRNLGTYIISDIHSFDKGQVVCNQINNRVSEILSFIEIASSVGIMSDMNAKILVKEFNELKQSVTEATQKNEKNWLEEFISKAPLLGEEGVGGGDFEITTSPFGLSSSLRRRENSIGQGTRIGVQKGSTLMKALSDKIPHLKTSRISIERNFSGYPSETSHVKHNIDILKNTRREEIILVIKDKMKSAINFEGVTITDIKSIGHGVLASCGEKTLQRELVSMVLDGVLKKNGEKRWSKYSLN